MSDVNLDSSFNWSSIRTGMEEMRAFSAQTTRNISKDVQGMFSGVIATTAIVAAFRSVIDQAVEIHREAQRFQIDAEQLQTIGNAAKQIGLPMETVARAMNLVELNAYKAAQGSAAQADALQRLGIDAQAFYALNSEQKILALADAYVAAGDKGSAYEAVATIIGKRNTELIPLFQKGSAAILEMGDSVAKFSDSTVERLARVHEQLLKIKSALSVTLGEGFADFVAGWQTGWYAIVSTVIASADISIANLLALYRALHFDFAGAAEAWKEWANAAKEQIKSVKDYENEAFGKGGPAPAAPGERTEPGTAASSSISSGGAGDGGSSGGSGGVDQKIKLEQQLAKVMRDNAFEQLSDKQKLLTVNDEIHALQLKMADTSLDENERLKANVEAEQKEGEAEKLIAKMSQDQATYDEQQAKLREQMAAQAESDLADSQEQTKELNLQAAGRKDLADRAKIEYDYNKQIHNAQNAITEAEKQGFTEIANTNRALVTQLSLEKQNALAAHDKAVAEEMAKKAAAESAAVDQEKLNLDTLKEENKELDLKIAGQTNAAELSKTEFDYNIKIKQALGDANDLWGQMAQAYADGNSALGDQLAKHAQLKQDEADELGLEKQKTLEMQRQAQELQAENDLAKAGIAPSRYADSPNGALGLSKSGTGLSYVNAQGNLVDIAAPARVDDSIFGGLASGNLRMGATSDVYAAALAHSRGIKPGTPEYQRLVDQITAQDQLREMRGQNLSFADQAARDKLVNEYAAQQEQQQTRAAATEQQDRMKWLQNIASGHPEYNNPASLFSGLYTNPALQNFGVSSDQVTSSLNQLIAQLSASGGLPAVIAVLQQIVANTQLVHV